ncbi:hypothetical protein NBO_12g0030 [Nosema bombycis CQ1]|uniref:Uncharacterized protein n=1 Tax=Nosema bombycis (strain CQ1 / CVCC 102059) TaxID=578461 RepID=R0MAF7_NOSB1|nr:hypothetical protein NBO_12g0030 [Nosema bombycis CQ1]|eukprot:EOB14924.1 hypothetical protein NBO_12g0030 [Nosema bombycis CQ1]
MINLYELNRLLPCQIFYTLLITKQKFKKCTNQKFMKILLNMNLLLFLKNLSLMSKKSRH